MNGNRVPQLLGEQQWGEVPIAKIDDIKVIEFLTNIQDISQSVGLVNYYRDMWLNLANTLAPLTKLCSTKVKFGWTDV